MKLQTSIKPRASGTVTLTGQDGKAYVFEKDADGALVCDVDHDATVIMALATDNFFPVDPADYEQALKLTGSDDDGDAPNDGGDPDGDDEGDPEFTPDTLPLEAGTPPKREVRPRKVKS